MIRDQTCCKMRNKMKFIADKISIIEVGNIKFKRADEFLEI